jgi:GxxExxY protein
MMDDKNYLQSDLTKKIIGCAYYVYNKLGAGFLEKVYENALALQLGRIGLRAQQQMPISVRFEGEVVGEFFADILVEDKVILELKVVSELSSIHEVQLVNYLKATGIKVGLLLNFGEQMKIVRRVFDPDQLGHHPLIVRDEVSSYDNDSSGSGLV